ATRGLRRARDRRVLRRPAGVGRAAVRSLLRLPALRRVAAAARGSRRGRGRGCLPLADLAARHGTTLVVTHREDLDTVRAWRCTGPRRQAPDTRPATPPRPACGSPTRRWRAQEPRASSHRPEAARPRRAGALAV